MPKYTAFVAMWQKESVALVVVAGRATPARFMFERWTETASTRSALGDDRMRNLSPISIGRLATQVGLALALHIWQRFTASSSLASSIILRSVMQHHSYSNTEFD